MPTGLVVKEGLEKCGIAVLPGTPGPESQTSIRAKLAAASRGEPKGATVGHGRPARFSMSAVEDLVELAAVGGERGAGRGRSRFSRAIFSQA